MFAIGMRTTAAPANKEVGGYVEEIAADGKVRKVHELAFDTQARSGDVEEAPLAGRDVRALGECQALNVVLLRSVIRAVLQKPYKGVDGLNVVDDLVAAKAEIGRIGKGRKGIDELEGLARVGRSRGIPVAGVHHYLSGSGHAWFSHARGHLFCSWRAQFGVGAQR